MARGSRDILAAPMNERAHQGGPAHGIRLDSEGRITAFGPDAEQVFDCPAAHAIGRPLAEIAVASLLKERGRTGDALKALEELAYSISHDLKSPLRHLDGFVRLLKDELGEGLSGDARHFVDVIADSSRHIHTLIDGLLALSRVASAPLHPAALDMAALVDDVVREAPRDDGSRKVHWEIGPLPGVIGDRTLLREVWKNLVDNALKFTGKRERAEIAIGSMPGGTYFIRDNGAGFEPGQAPKLFAPFQRLHHARDFEGIGMGLAIVRRIVERHGGKAWAEGRKGDSATFYFSLPDG